MTRAGMAKQQEAAVGLTALAIYALTAARSPQFGDGLEFMAAGASFGVPHPTGYPTITMLLHFAGGSYFAGTLICALFAAGAAALACTVARQILPEDSAGSTTPLRKWIPPFAGLMVAFSASLWSSATAIEVYGMNALLLMALLTVLLPGDGQPLAPRRLVFGAFLQGLALTNHLSSLCMAPLLGWQALRALPPLPNAKRAGLFGACIAAGLGGLLPYVYIPIRAATHPPINWGDASTWEGFRWLVGGGDYKLTQFLHAAPGVPFTPSLYTQFFQQRLGQLLSQGGAEWLGGYSLFDPAWGNAYWIAGAASAGLMSWGVWKFWHFNRGICLALLTATGLQLFFIFTYNIIDISDYFLGIWVTASPFLVLGFHALLNVAVQKFGYANNPLHARRTLWLMTALVLIAVGSNWKTADRSHRDIASTWIDRALDALPPNAIFLAQGDYDIYALWYAQQVEGQRPDVLVVGANFLRLDWYQTMLPQADKDPYGRYVEVEPGDFRQFTLDDHVEMLDRQVFKPHLGRVPIYTGAIDRQVLDAIAQTYRLQPRGLLLTEEEMELLLEWHPTLPPARLLEIIPPPKPENPAP